MFFVRPLAFEVDQNIRDFICLVLHYMHIPPQPYDKKMCNRFDGCAYRTRAGLIFASFHLLNPPTKRSGCNLGMCKLRHNGVASGLHWQQMAVAHQVIFRDHRLIEVNDFAGMLCWGVHLG